MARRLAALALFLALGAAPLAAEGPAPKLVAPETVYEAGEIKPGATVRHEFTIENQGEAPLELRDVSPGCGCTVASYDAVIAPGGRGRVAVATEVYEEWAGRDISKSLWVLTNDPRAPQLTLTVRGRVGRN